MPSQTRSLPPSKLQVKMESNLDLNTVKGFGDEWKRFDQSKLQNSELSEQFERYFAIFPWTTLPDNAKGFDMGCGSGRWAKLVAERTGRLHCIDASETALNVARKNLDRFQNIEFHH